jgi:hypothetical protein
MLDEIDFSHAASPEEQPHHVLIAENFPRLVRPHHVARLGLLRRFGTDFSAERVLK